MSELRPCGECRRHVAISETACPFCGSAPSTPSAVSTRLGRVSRAAVFAGAALATSACGGKKPKTETIDNTQPTATADAGVVQQAEPPIDEDPRRRSNESNIPMPYGAPPARRRVV